MTKAFTHLCEKINISIFDDTCTIYPKNSSPVSMTQFDSPAHQFLGISEHKSIKLKLIKVLDNGSFDLMGSVRADDPYHGLLHQDSFDSETTHYHVQFHSSIDEAKLNDILKAFEQESLVNAEGHEAMISAFREANDIDHTTTPENKPSQITASVSPKKSRIPDTVVERTESSFAGYQNGFFSQAETKFPSKPQPTHESQSNVTLQETFVGMK